MKNRHFWTKNLSISYFCLTFDNNNNGNIQKKRLQVKNWFQLSVGLNLETNFKWNQLDLSRVSNSKNKAFFGIFIHFLPKNYGFWPDVITLKDSKYKRRSCRIRFFLLKYWFRPSMWWEKVKLFRSFKVVWEKDLWFWRWLISLSNVMQ